MCLNISTIISSYIRYYTFARNLYLFNFCGNLYLFNHQDCLRSWLKSECQGSALRACFLLGSHFKGRLSQFTNEFLDILLINYSFSSFLRSKYFSLESTGASEFQRIKTLHSRSCVRNLTLTCVLFVSTVISAVPSEPLIIRSLEQCWTFIAIFRHNKLCKCKGLFLALIKKEASDFQLIL